MAYSDSKSRKVRSRSWTKADDARYEAQQRRARKDDAAARLEKERELAKLRANGTLDAYLETERQKRQAEEERYQQQVLEQKQRAEQMRLERSADARLMAGSLQSEFASAIGWKERFSQPEGDWLDDPVEAMITGYGFGEEMRTSRGIKMQVNLCLDCSNSVRHNGLDEVAQLTLRTMYLGLKMAAEQLPDNSLVVNVWTWAHNEDGKGVSLLTTKDVVARKIDNPMGVMDGWYANFNGEDTYIAPLFERLDGWENAYGDPSAYRLDIIITDGVLEHAMDAKTADVIQERRDGTLQTVVLNFLPMEEWTESRVPKRCVQYPATPDNLIGLMRGVLGSWLVNF
jgi:hypothetical protein